MGWMLLGVLVSAILFCAGKWRGHWLELRDLRAIVDALPAEQPSPQPAASLAAIEAIPLAAAGAALAKPPADYRLMAEAIRSKGPGRYRIPLGWYASVDGAELQTAQLVGDVNHILITGQSDSGKDNAALGMLLALSQQYTPDQLQVCIVDGKGGLDWAPWGTRAHCWGIAYEIEDIAPMMARLTSERQRRTKLLLAAGARKWDVYKGDDLPLLVVYVAELLLLQSATSKGELAAWLNAELTSARAMGIRYIVAAQNASNFDTQWRSQISLYLAGYQPLPSSDAPNIGMTATDADALGIVAPSRLPAPGSGAAGVFCAVQGAAGVNVRTTLIPDAQAEYLVRQLPAKTLQPAARQHTAHERPASPQNAPAAANDPMLAALLAGQPLPMEPAGGAPAIAHQSAPKAPSEPAGALRSGSALPSVASGFEALPVAVDQVPADEQRAIMDLAKRVNSRRAVCKQIYNQTGGAGYEKVRAVCDAAGLLMPAAPAQAVAA